MIDLRAWLLHTLGLDAYIESLVAAALWERTRPPTPDASSPQEQEPSDLAQLAANNAAFRARQSAPMWSARIHTLSQMPALRPPVRRPMPARVWLEAQARRKTEEQS